MPHTVMHRLREGKSQLRYARQHAPLSEKLRQLVYAQHLYVQIAGSRRKLMPWQKPWNVISDVRESVIFRGAAVEPNHTSIVTSSDSARTEPTQPWVLTF